MTTTQERAERAALEAKLRKRHNDRMDAMEKAQDAAYYAVLKAHGFEPKGTGWDEIPVWLSRAIDEADERAEEAARSRGQGGHRGRRGSRLQSRIGNLRERVRGAIQTHFRR